MRLLKLDVSKRQMSCNMKHLATDYSKTHLGIPARVFACRCGTLAGLEQPEVGKSAPALPHAIKHQEDEDFFCRDPVKHREILHRAVKVFTSLGLKLRSFELRRFKINNNLFHLWH